MDIFLSWSGARSKRVAQALQYWLPDDAGVLYIADSSNGRIRALRLEGA